LGSPPWLLGGAAWPDKMVGTGKEGAEAKGKDVSAQGRRERKILVCV